MERRMLSKEDSTADEVEVRREDQDKINKFSRLNGKESTIEDELKVKQKEKEDLEEVSMELELADEDDKIPYKIGDSFVQLPVSKVQELLAASTSRIEEDITGLEGRASDIREEMEELKVSLYARFGKSINLER